jgi:aspartyl-tRNA(Asn)/glutamyl-tRNA(Gln) amidotransferase subunit A
MKRVTSTIANPLRQYGIPRLTVSLLNQLYDAELISCRDVALYCYNLAVVGEETWRLHAFSLLRDRQVVLGKAEEADERRKRRRRLHQSQNLKLSPISLDGIPVSVKSNLAVAEYPLTAGSRILGAGLEATAPPIGYNADVVDCLIHDQGAVLIGLTSMDEFGMGSLGFCHESGVTKHAEKQTIPARNPRPLLQKLESYASHSRKPLDHKTIASIIRLPPEAILEAHSSIFGNEPTAEDHIPWLAPGGSSCGSAISIAHGSSIVSLASDTGGSVRLPAAWCGVSALKPSYGSLSRHGLVAYASSLDTVGILARTPECLFHTFSCLRRYNRSPALDATLIPPSSAELSELETVNTRSNLSGITVGIPAAFSVRECSDDLRRKWEQAIDFLEENGATIRLIGSDKIDPSLVETSLAAYYVVASAEASSNLARYDGLRYGTRRSFDVAGKSSKDVAVVAGSRRQSLLEQQYSATRATGFGSEVIRRVLCGTSVLSSDRFHTHYEAATRVRALLTAQLECVLSDGVDALIVPNALFPPPLLSCAGCASNDDVDATKMFSNDVMTVPANLTGLPAVSVPVGRMFLEEAGFDCGLFHPLQIVGSRRGEAVLLKIASALEFMPDISTYTLLRRV